VGFVPKPLLYKYCRGYCRYTVAATVTSGCYNPPPFKKSHPEIYDGKEIH
jgi:hypothetical protein